LLFECIAYLSNRSSHDNLISYLLSVCFRLLFRNFLDFDSFFHRPWRNQRELFSFSTTIESCSFSWIITCFAVVVRCFATRLTILRGKRISFLTLFLQWCCFAQYGVIFIFLYHNILPSALSHSSFVHYINLFFFIVVDRYFSPRHKLALQSVDFSKSRQEVFRATRFDCM